MNVWNMNYNVFHGRYGKSFNCYRNIAHEYKLGGTLLCLYVENSLTLDWLELILYSQCKEVLFPQFMLIGKRTN